MKFHAFPETEVYVNVNGHLVIKQEDAELGPRLVFLPASIAKAVARYIDEAELSDLAADLEDEGE